jgi:hypothetical protein
MSCRAAPRTRAEPAPGRMVPQRPRILSRTGGRCRRRPRAAGPAAGARPPAEAVRARTRRDVLKADPAAVACLLQRCQVPVEVEAARAGFVPPRRVGDLHVPGTGGIAGDRDVQVVAVDRQVVEVGEEPDVARPGLAGHPVGHGDGIGRRAERIGLGPAHRLKQHNRADARRRRGCACQVRGTEVILLGGADAVYPVTVERIEHPGAELLPDADRHVDIVEEAPRQAGDRQRPAVGSCQVAREEVQAHEGDPGVPDGADERVRVVVAGYGLAGPRPPELDRVEARGPARRGALEQRQLSEQERAVDVEPQAVAHHGISRVLPVVSDEDQHGRSSPHP